MNAVASGTVAQACGCVTFTEREKFVTMCPTHYATWRTVHDEAMADYRRAHPQVSETAP